tara:strand:- start:6966 stop:7973 length:1008 start_codon:yes stop_codon:yes gene_type:complete
MDRHLPTLILITLTGLCSGAVSRAQVPDHFSPDLQARLMEDGNRYLEQGDLANADAIFFRLFDSLRANLGLYNAQQISAIDRILAVALAARDHDRFIQYLGYHEQLVTRLYTGDTATLASELQRNARWHRAAAVTVDDELRSWHLIRSRTLTWQSISALETLPDTDLEIAALLYQITLSHFELSNNASRRGRTSMEVRTDQPALVSGWALSGSETDRRSYAIGTELLERIAGIYARQRATAGTMARITTYQGDWHTLFDRHDRALTYYRQAIGLLNNTSERDELLQELFGQETAIPVAGFDVEGRHLQALSSQTQRPGLADIIDASAANIFGDQP